jgi:hypothetical protein
MEAEITRITFKKNYGLDFNKLDVFDIWCLCEALFERLNPEQKKNLLVILEKI